MFSRFRPFEAPAAYEFKDPDTGFFYKASTQNELIKQINSYREQNKLDPLEELPLVIENFLCCQPENRHKCTGVQLNRSLISTIKGGIVTLTNLAFKSYATLREAETRASQCVKCKYNVFLDKTSFIKWSDDIAVLMVGEKKVKQHNQLGNCEVCSCPLRAKVFHGGKLKPFPQDQVDKMKTVDCWQLKLSGQSK